VAEVVPHLTFVHPEHSESTGPRSFSSARVPPLAATGTMLQQELLPRESPAEPADDGGLIAGDDEELNEAPLPRVDYFDSAALCEDWWRGSRDDSRKLQRESKKVGPEPLLGRVYSYPSPWCDGCLRTPRWRRIGCDYE